MTMFARSLTGKTTWHTTAAMPDRANHDRGLVAIVGRQTATEPRWDGAAMTSWSKADLRDGSGAQQGYFVNMAPDGDRNDGRFAGQMTTAGVEVTLAGTWQCIGGMGKCAGMTGQGTSQGRITSPTDVSTHWEGAYSL